MTRSRVSSRLRLPVPSQQLGKVGRATGWDPGQHIGQPGGRIKTVAAGCDLQAEDPGTVQSVVWVRHEEPDLISDAGWPDYILQKVRIDLIPAVFQVAHQRLPLTQCVPDSLSPWAFSQYRWAFSLRFQLD